MCELEDDYGTICPRCVRRRKLKRERKSFRILTENFFKASITGNGENMIFKWHSVFRYLECQREDLLRRDKLKIFCHLLFKLLTQFDCDNIAIITGVADLQAALMYAKLSPYDEEFICTEDEHFELIFRRFAQKKEMSYFYDCSAEFLCCCYDSVRSWIALRSYDVEFMNVLALYGIRHVLPLDCVHLRGMGEDILTELMVTLYDEKGIETEGIHDRSSRYMDVLLSERVRHEDTAEKRSNQIFNSSQLPRNWASPPSLRRIFLVLLGIDAVTQKLINEFRSKAAVKSIETYFKMIPYPMMTCHEMNFVLAYILDDLDMKDFLESLCEDFRQLFPECNREYQPRTLSHLARCKVREVFVKAGVLPIVVGRMNLPQEIKDYILCKPMKSRRTLAVP